MSAAAMTERRQEASPRLMARIPGILYGIIFIAAPFAEIFVRGKLVVYGDAAATASNILAHITSYLWGGAADLITFMCDAAVALIFYELFKPVPLHSVASRRRGTVADPVAPGDGGERAKMEGAGWRGGGVHPRMKAAVDSLPADW